MLVVIQMGVMRYMPPFYYIHLPHIHVENRCMLAIAIGRFCEITQA